MCLLLHDLRIFYNYEIHSVELRIKLLWVSWHSFALKCYQKNSTTFLLNFCFSHAISVVPSWADHAPPVSCKHSYIVINIMTLRDVQVNIKLNQVSQYFGDNQLWHMGYSSPTLTNHKFRVKLMLVVPFARMFYCRDDNK